MDYYIIQLLKAIFLPPGIIIILLLGVLFLFNFCQHYARLLLIISIGLIYFVSTPIVAKLLISSLEDYPALLPEEYLNKNIQAIVILGGGRKRNAAEFGSDIVSISTFERLRYGAFLHVKTKLPILVTGGLVDPEDTPEGLLMAQSLAQDFKLDTRWQENKSRNTAENALFSQKILAAEGINTILLVTVAWHMPRAVDIFKQQGFNIIPAPTGFQGFNFTKPNLSLFDFLPSGKAIFLNYRAIHEILGKIWYVLRY